MGFLIYEESTPSNYQDILEQMHIPYILSPWHNQDIDQSTGLIKKSHKHGALFFDSLKVILKSLNYFNNT